jgi:hypothetical protein
MVGKGTFEKLLQYFFVWGENKRGKKVSQKKTVNI